MFADSNHTTKSGIISVLTGSRKHFVNCTVLKFLLSISASCLKQIQDGRLWLVLGLLLTTVSWSGDGLAAGPLLGPLQGYY
jgi:hypothetical protein